MNGAANALANHLVKPTNALAGKCTNGAPTATPSTTSAKTLSLLLF